MRERVSKRKATPVQMELKSGSTSRSRSRSTNNTVCMCIKKLYRWCGTTQWLNRISKQNLNEHEHNKDNLQSKNNEKCEHLRFCEKRRNTMALRVLAAQHSSEEKLLTLAVSSRFSQENEVLELQFSCLRENYTLTPSLFLSSWFIPVFVFLFIMHVFVCVWSCMCFFSHSLTHTHTS